MSKILLILFGYEVFTDDKRYLGSVLINQKGILYIKHISYIKYFKQIQTDSVKLLTQFCGTIQYAIVPNTTCVHKINK